MNYIPAEKLITEIERQQRRLLVLLSCTKQADIRRDCALQNGVYEHILNFITSLKQEQPEVELEKEIISTCKEYRITEHSDAELGPLDIENIACYFYELGLNARKEEK